MANHARIFRDKDSLPPVEQIRKDVEEIVQRKFPLYTIEFNPENNMWWVGYGVVGESDNCLTFWLDETSLDPVPYPEADELDDFDWDKWNEEGPKVPCIEFRHGHSYKFLWWMEDEIRQSLAVKYNILEQDDGDGEVTDPSKNYTEYACWFDYLEHKIQKVRELDRGNESEDQFDEWVKRYLKYEFMFSCADDLPPEFNKMLYGDRKLEIQPLIDEIAQENAARNASLIEE